MWWKERRIPVVILTAVAVVGLLLAGSTLWRSQRWQMPLERAFGEMPGVVDARVTVRANEVIAYAHLAPGQDLRAVWTELQDISRRTLGEQPFRLVIVDNPSAELASCWEGMSFIIYEGLATGRLTEMRERALALARQSGVDCTLQVDDHAVYVSLQQGDHWLYQVCPWTASLGGEPR